MNQPNAKRELKKITLTPIEVYSVFGVCPGTLANWRWKRIGPRFFKRPGGRGVFYLLSDLEAYFLSHPVQTIDSIEEMG
jgi:hypothetical protein